MDKLVELVMPALVGLFEIPVFPQVLASTMVLAFTMFLIEYIFKVDI